MIPKEAVKEFQKIYHQVFKEKIDEETANIKARKFLNLYKTIFEAVKNRQNNENGYKQPKNEN